MKQKVKRFPVDRAQLRNVLDLRKKGAGAGKQGDKEWTYPWISERTSKFDWKSSFDSGGLDLRTISNVFNVNIKSYLSARTAWCVSEVLGYPLAQFVTGDKRYSQEFYLEMLYRAGCNEIYSNGGDINLYSTNVLELKSFLEEVGVSDPPLGDPSFASQGKLIQRKIVVGYLDAPPFCSLKRTEDGEIVASGVFAEALNLVLEKLGCSVEKKWLRCSNIEMRSEESTVDIIVPAFQTARRSLRFMFGGHRYCCGVSAVALPGSKYFGVRLSEDYLRQSRIKIVTCLWEVGYEAVLRILNIPQFRRMSMDHDEIAKSYGALENGDADVAIASSVSCVNFLTRHGLSFEQAILIAKENLFYCSPIGFLLCNNDSNLRRAILLEWDGMFNTNARLEELDKAVLSDYKGILFKSV